MQESSRKDGLTSSLLTSSRWFQLRDVKPGVGEEKASFPFSRRPSIWKIWGEMCEFKQWSVFGMRCSSFFTNSDCPLPASDPGQPGNKTEAPGRKPCVSPGSLSVFKIRSKTQAPKRSSYVSLWRACSAKLVFPVFCVLFVICPQAYLRIPWPKSSVLLP